MKDEKSDNNINEEVAEKAAEATQPDPTPEAEEVKPDPQPDSGQEEPVKEDPNAALKKALEDAADGGDEEPAKETPAETPAPDPEPEEEPQSPGPVEEDTDPGDMRSRNTLPEVGNDADDLFTIAVEVFDNNGAGFDVLGYSHGKTPEQAVRMWGTQYPDGLNYRTNGIWDPRLNGAKLLALTGDALGQVNNQ